MAGSKKIQTSEKIGFTGEMIAHYAGSLEDSVNSLGDAVFNSGLKDLKSNDLSLFRNRYSDMLGNISKLSAAVEEYGKILSMIGSMYEEARKKAVARAKKIPR